MPKTVHKPTADVLERVEKLLREELASRGIDIGAMEPHEISLNMTCGVHPDGALSYVWKDEPVLDVLPEVLADGTVQWRLLAKQRSTVQ